MCVSPYRREVDPDGKFERAWNEAYGIPADQKPCLDNLNADDVAKNVTPGVEQ